VILLRKSHIEVYRRQNKSGTYTLVKEHEDGRIRHDPEEPVTAPNGRDNFGMLHGEAAIGSGLPPLPIRLLQGKQVSDHHGFGLSHIKEQHGEELRKAGYKSEEEFVADVVQNFNAIYKVGPNRYALVADGKNQRVHIVEMSRDKRFYTVITGYIVELANFQNKRHQLLWKRMRKALEGVGEALQKVAKDWLRKATLGG